MTPDQKTLLYKARKLSGLPLRGVEDETPFPELPLKNMVRDYENARRNKTHS